jgi:hypothetical protein
VGVAGFLAIYFIASSKPGSGGTPGCSTLYGRECGTGLDTLGFLLSVLAYIGSLIAVVAGAYTASENRHRVKKLGWAFASLGVANIIALTAFLITL